MLTSEVNCTLQPYSTAFTFKGHSQISNNEREWGRNKESYLFTFLYLKQNSRNCDRKEIYVNNAKYDTGLTCFYFLCDKNAVSETFLFCSNCKIVQLTRNKIRKCCCFLPDLLDLKSQIKFSQNCLQNLL